MHDQKTLILKLAEAIRKHADNPEKVFSLAAELQGRLQLTDSTDEVPDIKLQVEEAIGELDDMMEHKGKKDRIWTGLKDLDKELVMLPGELIVIAAESSAGKTSMAFNILEHNAIEQRKPCLAFSLEMPARALIFRMMASQSKVDIRQATETGDAAAMKKLTEAATKIRNAPIFIEDDPDIDDLGVRSKTRKMVEEKGIKVVILDYIQLLSSAGTRDGTEAQSLSEKTMSLKRAAMEMKIAVIALSQVEEVSGKLYGSRAIQHHADTVLKIMPSHSTEDPYHVYIVKQRSGPRDRSIPLTFMQSYTRFENYAPEI